MQAPSRRHPHVASPADVPARTVVQGKHQMNLVRLGAAAGSHLLGANLTEVPPGCVSFPFHYHCATEEAIYVLSGTGQARIGNATVEIGPGDWIAFPPGPEAAHQMINNGSETLRYLCISAAVQKVDIVGYPDSGKLAATAGTFEKPLHRVIVREGNNLDYWDGEPLAK